MSTMVKFRDVPLGGRIVVGDNVWIVLERHGRGKIAQECLEPKSHQSLCCFTDPDEGITLDTEVEFLGLELVPPSITREKLLQLIYHDDEVREAIREAAEPLPY